MFKFVGGNNLSAVKFVGGNNLSVVVQCLLVVLICQWSVVINFIGNYGLFVVIICQGNCLWYM